MAKRLLLNILVDVLGNFVEGLSIENLKLGVLSGKVELFNLKLKSSGLNGLNLPISITHGSLKKLQLKIPWTALESKPVKVIIDGIYLQAGPLDVMTLSSEQLKKMACDALRQRLKSAENAAMASDQTPEGIQEKTQKASYIQQLTAKIVDNIEITLTNVHIRYEDSITIPGNVLSAGITIESISLATTDDQWNEAFVARKNSSGTTAIHKLGRLQNIGVYWNTKSQALEKLSSSDWELAMQDLIYITPTSSNIAPNNSKKSKILPKDVINKKMSASTGHGVKLTDYRNLEYIIATPNSLHVKIVHIEHPVDGEPKIDVRIESSNLDLNLDKRQYQQLIGTTVVFNLLERQKQLALLRPPRRPTKDPSGWWHYAYKLTTGRTVSAVSKIDLMMRCMKTRKRYITLVQRSRMASDYTAASASGGAAPSAHGANVTFSAANESELRGIEDSLPVQALLVFRQLAAYKMIDDIKREEKERSKENKSKNIMATFGWNKNNVNNSPKNLNSNSNDPAVRDKDNEERDHHASSSSFSISSWFQSNVKKAKKSTRGSETTSEHHSKRISDKLHDMDDYDEDDDEQLIAIIQSKLELDPAAGIGAGADQFIFRLILTSSATLRLTSEQQPVSLLQVALSSTTEMTADGVVLTFALDDLQLIDECSENPLTRFLVVSLPDCILPSSSSSSAPTPPPSSSSSSIAATSALTLKRPLNPFATPPHPPISGEQEETLPSSSRLKNENSNLRKKESNLSIVIDSRHGKSVLHVTARPLEATWNELCVARLLGIFLSPDITHSHLNVLNTTGGSRSVPVAASPLFNPLLVASLNKFALEAALPIAGEMELIVEIHAPKIIIPDDCCSDRGCLLFDAGFLVIIGVIGETSMHMDISLKNVNVGLPTSMEGKYNTQGKSLYLIKPFDIQVGVQSEDTSVADVTVTVSISPGLQAEFDAAKVARLIRLINVVVVTIQEALNPTSGSGNTGLDAIQGVKEQTSPSSLLLLPFPQDGDQGANDRLIAATSSSCNTSAAHCWVDVKVDLPLITIDLNVTSMHTVTLTVTSFDTHVVVREHDLQLFFSLKDLNLLDSSRSKEQRAIISTPPLSLKQHQLQQTRSQQHQRRQLKIQNDGDKDKNLPYASPLVSVSYCFMYSRQSPLFLSHGQNLQIDFASLGLSIDEEAVTRLKPFLEVLAKEMNMSRIHAPPTPVAAVDVSVVSKVGPIGMLVTVSVGSVSLSLMRQQPSPSKDTVSQARKDGRNIDKNSSLLSSKFMSKQLETAFTVKVMDMYASIDMRICNVADVKLRSFTIVDCRYSSEKHVYKEMLCNSTLGSQHDSTGKSDSPEDKRRGTTRYGDSPVVAEEEQQSDILSVIYKEATKGSATVEIELKNVSSFISVDSVIELVDVVLCCVDAVVGVVNALGNSSSVSNDINNVNDITGGLMNATDGRSGVKTLAAAPQPHPQQTKTKVGPNSPVSYLMNVIVTVVNPRLLLLEDPACEDSRAIVLRCGVSVHYCNDSKSACGSMAKLSECVVRENIQVSIQTLELFSVTGLTRGRPQQIVEPTSLDLHINRNLSGSTVLTTSVSLIIGVVTAKISVNDIVLANSILSKAGAASDGEAGGRSESISNKKDGVGDEGEGTESSPRTPIPSRCRSSTLSSSLSVPPVPSTIPDGSATNGTVYNVIGQVGAFTLVAINDFKGQLLPILKLSVEHTEFSAGGKLTDFHAEGYVQICVEHYNTRVATWEPVLEPWGPRLSVVSDDANGTVLEVTSDNTLQLNVSGAMAKTLSHLVNLYSTIIEEFEYHSQVIRNSPNQIRNATEKDTVSLHLQSSSSSSDVNRRNKPIESVFSKMITDKSLSSVSDSPVTFRNHIEFPIEIFDSLTHDSLMVLRSGESGPLVHPGSLARSWVQNEGKHPTLFNVKVLGRFRDQRLPLLHLPLNINRPRPYYLQPDSLSAFGSERSKGLEPIIEETYENQRYDPMELQWSLPWVQLSDPPDWTDALGVDLRNPSSVRLPSDSWEWVERDWKVDLCGVIGKEIDEKGWEYATNFTSFSLSKKRRSKKPMDVTRRRRWIRSRTLKSTGTAAEDLLMPLIVIWDVVTDERGAKIATVRSGLQVRNLMPFPLSVAIDGFPGTSLSQSFDRLGEEDQASNRECTTLAPFRAGTVGRIGGPSARIFDNIPEGELFSLPLLLSSASLMRFRPSGTSHQWSQAVSCRSDSRRLARSLDGNGGMANSGNEEKGKANEDKIPPNRDLHDLNCPLQLTPQQEPQAHSSVPSIAYMQALLLTADRSRLLMCLPYAVCHNHLPCALSYRFIGGVGHSEQGSLSPGATVRLAGVSLTCHPHGLLLSVRIGTFQWSTGILVDPSNQERQTLDLYEKGGDGGAPFSSDVGVSLSMTVTFDEYRIAHIKIFSRFALVDRSGLNASVRTKRGRGRGLPREGAGAGGALDFDLFNIKLDSQSFYSKAVDRHTYTRTPLRGKVQVQGLASQTSERNTGIDVDRNIKINNREEDASDASCSKMNSDGSSNASTRNPMNMNTINSNKNASYGLNRKSNEVQADECKSDYWIKGGSGMVLFHCDPLDCKASIGINRGAAWSDPMSLLALGTSKVPFEITDEISRCTYHLAFSTTQLPGVFKTTQLVTLIPCYCIVNCLDEFIEVRQMGALKLTSKSKEGDFSDLLFPSGPVDLTPSKMKCTIPGQSTVGWHSSDTTKGTAVQIRSNSSAWSFGTVDFNEIGTTVLLVPKKRLIAKGEGKGQIAAINPQYCVNEKDSECREDAIVIHVEVRFADPSDHSYVNIVIWAPSMDKEGNCHQAALSVRNDTPFPFIIQQTGTAHLTKARGSADPSRYSISIAPGDWRPFGWLDQTHGTSLTLTVSSDTDRHRHQHLSQSQLSCSIDMSIIGQTAIMHMNNPSDVSKITHQSRTGTGTERERGGGKGRAYDSSAIEFTVMAAAVGSVLHITTKLKPFTGKMLHQSLHNEIRTSPLRDLTVVMSLQSLGVSLIAERPLRREFASLYMDEIDCRFVQKRTLLEVQSVGEKKPPSYSMVSSYGLEIADMQIDNYSETAVFPVLMHSYNASQRERKKTARRRKRAIRQRKGSVDSEEGVGLQLLSPSPSSQGQSLRGKQVKVKEEGAEDYPFLTLSVVQELAPGSITPIFKYVALRILEIKLAVDSSTLQLYFCDLDGDLRGESREELLAGSLPTEWVEEFNQLMVAVYVDRRTKIIHRNNRKFMNSHKPSGKNNSNNFFGELVNIARTLQAAQQSKMYFENLIIHPIKIRLSFLPSPFPRSKHEDILSAEEYKGLKIIKAIAQVDDLVVKINSFELKNSMDSVASLGDRLVSKTLRDLQSHLMQIVGGLFGSLELIGRPAGLYRNVGEGIKGLFYEPYEGLMQSPEAFIAGLGKGTGGLMRGVVSGAITSTAAIVGSASKGVAQGFGVVSGDREFVRQRDEKRRVNTASSGGLLSGVRAGGESVFSGFASGLTGLATRPFEEGRRGGALGFVKGVGLGLAGAVTKPILGLTDGIASVVHGISNQVSDVIVITTARPPRAFDRSSTSDVTERVLLPLDLAAAHAQEFVFRAARRGGYTDSFISHVSTDGSQHGCFTSIISSPQYSSTNYNKEPLSHSQKIASSASVMNTAKRLSKVDSLRISPCNSVISDPNKTVTMTCGSSVVVSELFVFVLYRDQSLQGRYAFGEISHCTFVSDTKGSRVHLVLYQNQTNKDYKNISNPFDLPFDLTQPPFLGFFGDTYTDSDGGVRDRKGLGHVASPVGVFDSSVACQQKTVEVHCHSKAAAARLHTVLASCSLRMGNPSNITNFGGYRFGEANHVKHTPSLSSAQCTEKDVISRAARRLAEPIPSVARPTSTFESDADQLSESRYSDSYTVAKVLDERMWQVVGDWRARATQQQLQRSRCLALLIINQSKNPTQILRTDVLEGRNVVIFSATSSISSVAFPGGSNASGYDEESRTLMGGGAAVVFAFGFIPSPIDPAHVKLEIVTTAFNATVSTRPNATRSCVAVGGYMAGYHEKSLADYWAKYVIIVN